LQGVTGPSGIQGIQGITGPSGIQGGQGDTGVTGPSGLQGVTGPSGVQGIQGVTGPSGTIGIDGITGATGLQGIQGVTGPSGTIGIDGITGATGPQGIQGVTGPSGVQGIQGVTGPSGTIGINGITGATGPSGLQGVSGATGPQGNQGGLIYKFSTTVYTSTIPANGTFAFNSATISSVTTIALTTYTAENVYLGSYITSWNSGTAVPKGTILIKGNTNNDATYCIFTLTSVGDEITNFTNYMVSLTVTYVSGTLPSNLETCVLIFIPKGDKGDTGFGIQGNTGDTGPTGPSGVTGGIGNTGATGTTPPIGGSNTQIQFNNSGSLGGSANLTWDGTYLKATYLNSTNSVGDDGGEILLSKPATNSTLSGTGITIDSFQNRLRFFEQGGSARGAYIDISACAGGVGTDLLAGGGGGGGATGPTGPTGPSGLAGANGSTGSTGPLGTSSLARLTLQTVTGTSLTSGTSPALSTSTYSTYYYITNSAFNALTLPSSGTISDTGAFWTLRNSTGAYLGVTVTATGMTVTNPIAIPPLTSVTIVYAGSNTYYIF
jgi:hypothetical protein